MKGAEDPTIHIQQETITGDDNEPAEYNQDDQIGVNNKSKSEENDLTVDINLKNSPTKSEIPTPPPTATATTVTNPEFNNARLQSVEDTLPDDIKQLTIRNLDTNQEYIIGSSYSVYNILVYVYVYIFACVLVFRDCNNSNTKP